MRTRRLGVAAVGLIAAAALVAGCQATPKTEAGATPSAAASSQAPTQASAADALSAATTKLKTTTAKITMTMGGTASMKATGSLDGPNKKAAMNMVIGAMGQNLTMDTVQIGDEVWLKYAGVPGLPKDWMHVDITKLGPNSTVRKSLEDPSFSENLLRSAAQVSWDGTNKVKGTLDMTKSPTMNPAAAAALGDKATAVPFTAAFDDQGRLVNMTVAVGEAVPQAGITDMVVAYSGFGEPVTVEKPAGKVIEAPVELLANL
ncbi:hypothetical protein [Catellatospora vulcania]|uniref:hypothetical protein n=1 Tax=Catellatospora vulcania TaxID=1460450 RepID=UPI0012D3E968|nr:hypothetical protein [Catellatospora vulcania]